MASSAVWTDARGAELDRLVAKEPRADRGSKRKESLDETAAEMRKKYARRIGPPPWVAQLLRRHATAAGVPMREITGENQTPEVVAARVSVAVELRKHRLSMPAIGKYLGGKHHTTVMHYLKLAEKRAEPIGEIPCPDFSGEWAI